jgi:hypothetical protein
MLLRPTNQVFEGMPMEKRVFARLLRGTLKEDRPALFGDELLRALDRLPEALEIERKKTQLKTNIISQGSKPIPSTLAKGMKMKTLLRSHSFSEVPRDKNYRKR